MNGSLGVVCLTTQGPRCATCNQCQSKCKHISYLQEIIQDNDEELELSPRLKMFQQFAPSNPKAEHDMKTISKNIIPFNLSLNMIASVKRDYSQRFNICNGIASLIPAMPSSSHCPTCNCEDSWSEVIYLAEEAFLVTPMCCYPAKGFLLFQM